MSLHKIKINGSVLVYKVLQLGQAFPRIALKIMFYVENVDIKGVSKGIENNLTHNDSYTM